MTRAGRASNTNFVMWKGRFTKSTAGAVQQLGESVSFDHRLFRQDIRGSIAHARAQHRAGLLTGEELEQIETGLRGIGADIEAGAFEFSTELEDVHMNIEAELTRRIGDVGAKLHAARSRNDQVATDTRLYCRDVIDEALLPGITRLQRALVNQGRRNASVILPGYTHLQRAQPVLLAHHLLAYVDMLERDADRLRDCRKRLNICPLGSGALAGSTINLDREGVAAELEFDGVSRNSMDAVSDRDFIAELLFALALTGVHLSRLSEDLILWSSSEFSFVTLSDEHTTGSSLMPQKKNPDVAELTRGKAGRLIGNLMALLTVIKGLPMTYNRDLQEDKEPLFDSIDTMVLVLEVYAEMIDGMEVSAKVMARAAGDPMLLATDLADHLVRQGVPFRQAHECVGRLVAESVATGTPLDRLPQEVYDLVSNAFGEEARQVFDLQKALSARTNHGSPGFGPVEAELARWEDRLRVDRVMDAGG